MIEFDLLTEIVKELTGVTREEIISKKRLRTLVEIRMACASILRDYSQKNGKKLTVFQLGEILNIDHSSVSYYSATHYKILSDFNSNKNRNYRVLYEQMKSAFDIRVIPYSNIFLVKNKDRKNIYLEKKKSLEKELKMINDILLDFQII